VARTDHRTRIVGHAESLHQRKLPLSMANLDLLYYALPANAKVVQVL